MAMDLAKLRKLVMLDPHDPLSRFALGKKLFETAEQSPDPAAALAEAAEHLRLANSRSPEHLATYHILAQVLIRLRRSDEARAVLQAGLPRAEGIGQGMGRDLAPAMRELLNGLH